MLRSGHLRDEYRRALGVTPGQKLVTVSSTWWRRSVMGTWPSLFRELLACLPADEYRVAAVIHPNIWHGHGPWQVHTWLADCVRAGLLLAPPEEGWQALLIASDVVVGDHGATSCYAAGLGGPVLLAAFPHEDVAPGSAADLLGGVAPRIHRHGSLRAQVEAAIRTHDAAPYQRVRDALSSCPGESAARLRALFYAHLRLPEPAGGDAPVPVIEPATLSILPGPDRRADHVVCRLGAGTSEPVSLLRYPADVSPDGPDDAFLVVHEDHPQRALLDSAAVILAGPGRAALEEALRHHPGATLAATATTPCVVRVRDGEQLVLDTEDAAVAASLVHAWLLADRPLRDLPPVTTVVAGPRRFEVRTGSAVPEPVAE